MLTPGHELIILNIAVLLHMTSDFYFLNHCSKYVCTDGVLNIEPFITGLEVDHVHAFDTMCLWRTLRVAVIVT